MWVNLIHIILIDTHSKTYIPKMHSLEGTFFFFV